MVISRRSFLKGVAALAVASALPWTGEEKPKKNLQPVPLVETYGEFRTGDVVTFEGIYAKQPITGKSTKLLQQFVIISTDPVKVSPPLYLI